MAGLDPSVALLDGTVVPASTPLLRADDLGVLRGEGVFETTLVVDGVPRDLPEHLQRMTVSAHRIELPLPPVEAWQVPVAALVAERSDDPEWTLRLVVTRGAAGDEPTCYATAGPLPASVRAQRTDGVRVRLLDRGFSASSAAAAPWLLAGAKTLSYAVNMAALRAAHAQGDDDAVFVGADGSALEAPTATLVLVWDRSLVTPPLDGILDGITVRRLFAAAKAAGWETGRHPVPAADLHAADGVWLVSSARLLAPVTAVNGTSRDSFARVQADLTTELARLLEVPGAA
jgi:4-amino-4-deoxychorismate lyase